MMAKRRTSDFDIYQQHGVGGKGDIGRLVMFGDPVSGWRICYRSSYRKWLKTPSMLSRMPTNRNLSP